MVVQYGLASIPISFVLCVCACECLWKFLCTSLMVRVFVWLEISEIAEKTNKNQTCAARDDMEKKPVPTSQTTVTKMKTKNYLETNQHIGIRLFQLKKYKSYFLSIYDCIQLSIPSQSYKAQVFHCFLCLLKLFYVSSIPARIIVRRILD